LPIMAADQPLRKAAEVMLANKALAVITLDVERRPELILSFRRLVKTVAEGVNIDKEQIAKYAVADPAVIRFDDTIEEALRAMKKEAVRTLPVVDYRNKMVGYLEARHIAFKLWKLLPYGLARVEAQARNIVVMPPDATLQAAAKAMDDNGVTEVFVRRSDGELAILREWDFLRALAEGADPAEARIGDYATGRVIKIPVSYDARAAVELMEENDVLRLVAVAEEGEERGRRNLRVVTASDLAFEALEHLEKVGPKAVALVLANVEPGREEDVAIKLLDVPEVVEVLSVPGVYDLVIRVEAKNVDRAAEVVTKKIRSLREIRDTLTLVAAPLYRKRLA
ncbi:MAG: CBS domain-containing protein, partial [Crenarchaeota archaeon]|nr:CBS domain-containing protein [Thermoproteota archaeon]